MPAVMFRAAPASRSGDLAPRGPSADSTASVPRITAATAEASSASPAVVTSEPPPGPPRRDGCRTAARACGSRARACTSWPDSSAQLSRWPPIRPLPPSSATRMVSSSPSAVRPRRDRCRDRAGTSSPRASDAGSVRRPAPRGSASISRKARKNTPTWNHSVRSSGCGEVVPHRGLAAAGQHPVSGRRQRPGRAGRPAGRRRHRRVGRDQPVVQADAGTGPRRAPPPRPARPPRPGRTAAAGRPPWRPAPTGCPAARRRSRR